MIIVPELTTASKGERARKNLVRTHEKVVNRRTDWFWKLANELTDKFDYLYFENLNLKGMQRLWGRKISDLAFSEFLKILEYVAENKNKIISYIDRWYPSSKTCSVCDYVLDKLPLDTRYWQCPSCSTKHGRDSNAATNILRVGSSTLGAIRSLETYTNRGMRDISKVTHLGRVRTLIL